MYYFKLPYILTYRIFFSANLPLEHFDAKKPIGYVVNFGNLKQPMLDLFYFIYDLFIAKCMALPICLTSTNR